MHSKELKRRMRQQQQTERNLLRKHIPWANGMAVRICKSNYSALVETTWIGQLKALLEYPFPLAHRASLIAFHSEMYVLKNNSVSSHKSHWQESKKLWQKGYSIPRAHDVSLLFCKPNLIDIMFQSNRSLILTWFIFSVYFPFLFP